MHATTAELSGDLIFVIGAHAKSFDLPFDKSHRDRGVRNDDHDAIGIELRVIVESEPEPLSKRTRFAPQPVRDDDGASKRARDRVRWAKSLHRQMMKGRKKFTHEKQALLDDPVLGTLQEAANDATRNSGYGRIIHPDGSFSSSGRREPG